MPYWPANERHKFLQTKHDAPHPALPQQALPGAASARAQLDAEVGLKQESAHAAFGSCVEGLGMVRGLPHWSQEMPQTGMRPAIPLQVLASALATRLLARSFSSPPPLLLSPLCRSLSAFPPFLPPGLVHLRAHRLAIIIVDAFAGTLRSTAAAGPVDARCLFRAVYAAPGPPLQRNDAGHVTDAACARASRGP